MFGHMAGLVINVDVCTLDIRERLDLHLERFGAVVGLAHGLVLVDDDVDFYDQARAGVPGSDCVEGGDERAVGHGWRGC